MSKARVRAAYKGQLTSVNNALAKYLSDDELLNAENLGKEGARIHIETQLMICERIRSHFCKAQYDVIDKAATDEEREAEIQELDRFMTEIDAAETQINELVVKIKVSESAKGDLFSSTIAEDNRVDRLLKGFSVLVNQMESRTDPRLAKLEAVKIPTFSGLYAEWPAFRDLFEHLVENNYRLTDVQKLHYLKTSLQGKAKGVIEHLSLCDANYSVAWDALVERFESKTNIVKEHIERLKNLPVVKTPRGEDLRTIYDVSMSSVCALDSLKVTERDPWIIYEVVSKLDAETQTLWSREVHEGELPTWLEFKAFLNKRCKSVEECPSTFSNVPSQSSSSKNLNSNKVKQKPVKSLTISNTANSNDNHNKPQDNCNICQKPNHKLWKYGKFKSMPAAKRLETVNKLNLCLNCMSESKAHHSVDQCPYPHCKHCNKSHNFWVHDALTQAPSANLVTGDLPTHNPSSDPKPPVALVGNLLPSSNAASGRGTCRAILKTACVRILDSQENAHFCRALFDFGSEISVITTSLCQRLRLKLERSPYSHVEGFQGQVSAIKHQVTTSLVPPEGPQIFVQCQVTPKISSNLPTCHIRPDEIQIPSSYELADANWHESRPVDLLIGAAHEDEVMLNEVLNLGPGNPSLRKSIFGWIVCGKWTPEMSQSPTSAVCNIISLKIDDQLEKFWLLEELSEEDPQTVEHREVEELYTNTTKRSVTGQYVVQLPLKGDFGELGSNRRRAARQLTFLEKRLSKNSQLYHEYSKIFEEYLSLGIIEKVPPSELLVKSYYMTHHCVVRENVSSTKVRIVFNCGSVSESGKSLNDVMKVGPVVQSELIEILWRFRLCKVALSCDVVKMYLQVQLVEAHKDFQRFLWRENPKDSLTDYRFRTLCFGNAASPYLATKTLVRLAEDEEHNFPQAANVLRNNFYVDDCLLSVSTVEEATEIQSQLINILDTAQMKLSKWQSNSVEVLQAVQGEETENLVMIADSWVKALGMVWNPCTDIFVFKVDESVEQLLPTKRNVLSVIARLYDPLGLLAPVTVNAKLIIQNLWKAELDWDTQFSGDLLQDWKNFLISLKHVPNLKIPRWISAIPVVEEHQLHMFADASKAAYGAMIYVLTREAEGGISCRMLTSKSKVAPVKTKTIPKLELCAATLGARLVAKVSRALKVSQIHCWIDAKVELAQIASASNKQDVFTKTRVTTIRELTKVECWNHVPTKENPADLISRGTTAMELENSTLYFQGPTWLMKGEAAWPNTPEDLPELEEETAAQALHIVTPEEDHIFKTLLANFSSITKMKRTLLSCVKFVQALRFSALKRKGHSIVPPNSILRHTISEWAWAEKQLIKWDQEIHLGDLITAVALKRPIENKPLLKMNPFLDSEGILRMGGRLGHLDDDYNTRFPKILPRSGLTYLILQEMHVRLLHAGPQLLLAYCRRQYWPLGGRHTTRGIVSRCKTCFVHTKKRENQIMAELPVHRISLIQPFLTISIDCCGPFKTRAGAESRGTIHRMDVVVFVCTATKAVHLEIVSKLSTQAFLASFRRFTSRRGVPREVFTDNGKNFVGASRAIQRLLAEENEKIQDQTRAQKITWHFQPPRSPHFCGLAEAAVKSTKTHLKKAIGDQVLNYEEFYTLLTEVEAVLNSRPLFDSSDDPRDPLPLTPGHLVMMRPPTQLPDEDLQEDDRINYNQRWQLVQRIVQQFTRNWKLSYLHTLQRRTKWHEEKENLKLEDIVILHDETVSRNNKWTTGRVIGVHKGQDGRVRVVDVRTPTGTYTRAITRVVKVPTCESHSSPGSMNRNLSTNF